MEKLFTTFIFSEPTQTVRTFPENYWIASVVNGHLVFDSWDGSIVDRFKKKDVEKFWKIYQKKKV